MLNQAGKKEAPTIVFADLALNHNGEPGMAARLVELAIQCKADGVVMPLATIEHLGTREVLNRPYHDLPEWGTTWREVRSRCELPFQAWQELRDKTRGQIPWFVAPFDLPAYEQALLLDPDGIVLTSPCAADTPLLRQVLQDDPRVLVCSVVGIREEEIQPMMSQLGDRLVLLWEAAVLRGKPGGVALSMLDCLRSYGCRFGYTDHLPEPFWCYLAAARGASLIIKGLAFDRLVRGLTQSRALNPMEFTQLVKQLRVVGYSLNGAAVSGLPETWLEATSLEESKGLVAACDLPAGHVLRREDVVAKPPLRGLTPKHLDFVVGKKLLYDLREDDPITFGVLAL